MNSPSHTPLAVYDVCEQGKKHHPSQIIIERERFLAGNVCFVAGLGGKFESFGSRLNSRTFAAFHLKSPVSWGSDA